VLICLESLASAHLCHALTLYLCSNTTWYAYVLALWAVVAFFLGIFAPFGFPSWALSVPLLIMIALFVRLDAS